jgi:hypothetical protein
VEHARRAAGDDAGARRAFAEIFAAVDDPSPYRGVAPSRRVLERAGEMA